jgi:hypothetical protein
LDITNELQFYEDGKMVYTEYQGIHKKALPGNFMKRIHEDPEYFLSPMDKAAFFFDDWGGDTYEVWKKQKEGQDIKLFGIANNENLFFAEILDQSAQKKEMIEEIGYQYEPFENENFVGYKASVSFENFENAKVFFKDPANTKILNELIEEIDVDEQIGLDILNSISVIGREIKMDYRDFQKNNLALKEIIEFLNNLLELSQIEEVKDLSLNLRVKLPYPAQVQNASSVTNDGKTLEWNLLEVDKVEFAMVPINISQAKGTGILETVILLVFLCMITIGIILYIDTKKNPKYGIIARYKNRKWIF